VAESRALRVLIVDDEPLGIERLRELVEEQPNVEVVGTADDGVFAVQAIRTLCPDLVFLDVQMPRKTGIDVVREVGPEAMPATIFVTAYDQYALQAFDFAAIDYLVKPYDDERFEEAFRRARRKIELEGLDRLRDQLLNLLQRGSVPAGTATPPPQAGAVPASGGYLDRIAVQMKGKMRVVPVAQIEYITASGPYAELHVGPERHIIRESMQNLEEQLDPGRFMRIHRSAIVRIDLVDSLLRGGAGHRPHRPGGQPAARGRRRLRSAAQEWRAPPRGPLAPRDPREAPRQDVLSFP
jgi:two-component system, LytTR family, response regulator